MQINLKEKYQDKMKECLPEASQPLPNPKSLMPLNTGRLACLDMKCMLKRGSINLPRASSVVSHLMPMLTCTLLASSTFCL